MAKSTISPFSIAFCKLVYHFRWHAKLDENTRGRLLDDPKGRGNTRW
jgi:hypothetical protein